MTRSSDITIFFQLAFSSVLVLFLALPSFNFITILLIVLYYYLLLIVLFIGFSLINFFLKPHVDDIEVVSSHNHVLFRSNA